MLSRETKSPEQKHDQGYKQETERNKIGKGNSEMLTIVTVSVPNICKIPLMHAPQTGLNAGEMSIRCNAEKYIGQSMMPSTK